jgi:opacity protein-like surface antigen
MGLVMLIHKLGFGGIMTFSKGIIVSAAFASLSLASPQAGAADIDPVTGYPIYISIFGGASFLEDVDTTTPGNFNYSVNTKTGFLIGGAVGLKWNDIIRTEIELSHTRSKAKSYTFGLGAPNGPFPAQGPISATYLLGNIWADLNTDSAFTPYVGGGLGIGWADGDTSFSGLGFGYGPGESGLAFQLGAGVKYDMSESFSIDLGYRYKGLKNIDFEDNDGSGAYNGGDLFSHNVQVGLSFNF